MTVFADITVGGDSETMLVLAEPPGKIVRLSPYLTEFLFSLRVGNSINARAEFSDYPEAVLEMLRLGNMFSVRVEAFREQSSDSIVAWTGSNQRAFEQLRPFVNQVFVNEASSLGGNAAAVQ